MLPKAFNICPKSNKSPDLVILERGLDQLITFKSQLTNVFLKMGESRPLFCLLSFFSHSNSNDKYIIWKKHRWCAVDSNPGRLDGRRRWIHWAMAAPLKCYLEIKISLIFAVFIVTNKFRFFDLSTTFMFSINICFVGRFLKKTSYKPLKSFWDGLHKMHWDREFYNLLCFLQA